MISCISAPKPDASDLLSNSCANLFWLGIHQLVPRKSQMITTQIHAWLAVQKLKLEKMTRRISSIRVNLKKAYNTWGSQAVTHPSTNQALSCLTSVIRREPVHSTGYGRRQCLRSLKGIYMKKMPTFQTRAHQTNKAYIIKLHQS